MRNECSAILLDNFMDLNYFDLIRILQKEVGVAVKKRGVEEESKMETTKEKLNHQNATNSSFFCKQNNST